MRDDPLAAIVRDASILEGTAAVSPDGSLLVLHHATNLLFSAFSRSSDMGFHFGTKSQAEKRRSIMIQRQEASDTDPWRVVSAVLAVRNPLVIADDPGIWGPRWLTATLVSFLDDNDRSEIRDFASRLDRRPAGTAFTEADEAAVRGWHAVLRRALVRAGHDGIVYRNVFEASGRATEWSWVVFEDRQIVRIGLDSDLSTVPVAGIPTGKAPRLRGAGPMRHHQDRGIGFLVRDRDVLAFREAVLDWAAEAGVDWIDNYPLDYEPSFGECRPQNDLRAKVGSDRGITIQVCSRRGIVVLAPFASGVEPDTIMDGLHIPSSEGFFEYGLPNPPEYESVTWRPAEGIGAFCDRLAAVFGDLSREFIVTPDLARPGHPGGGADKCRG